MKKVLYVGLIVVILACSLSLFACKDDVSVDMDLSKMNASLSYAEAYNINTKPADYEGKVVRIKGTFSRGKLNGSSTEHYFIDVYDGTCCTTWVAFKWDGELPSRGKTLVVTGTLKSKKGGGSYYPEIEAQSVEF